MVRRSRATLHCEALEARDVPAIVLDALGITSPDFLTTNFVPVGGSVSISEVQFVSTGQLFDGSTQLRLRDGTVAPAQTKVANANDAITLSLAGTALTITCSDGIFGRASGPFGLPVLVTFGNALTINNATALGVTLQLGGNDSVTLNGTAGFSPTIATGPGNDRVTLNGTVGFAPTVTTGSGNDTITDNTALATAINAGDGNDTITALGSAPNQQLLLFLIQQARSLDPSTLMTLATGPRKLLGGGDGNDTLGVSGLVFGFVLDGGGGNDTINAPSGLFNTFLGGAGNDTINGSPFGLFNLLDGGADDDMVMGGFGPDFINGGVGLDVLMGFGGLDFYSARDVDADIVLNVIGDLVSADAFDSVAVRPAISLAIQPPAPLGSFSAL